MRFLILLLLIALAITGCGQEITPTTAASSTTTTTLPTVYWSGRTISSIESYSSIRIFSTGNVSIESGGTLTLEHVTLYMSSESDAKRGIFVNSGGTLNITRESVVTAYNTAEGYYSFSYKDGSAGNIYNSTVEGAFSGVSVEADNFKVSGSTIRNSKSSGLTLINCAGTIEGNMISHNQQAGIVLGGTVIVKIQNNNLAGNLIGLKNNTATDIKAQNNYWGYFSAGAIQNYNNDTAMRIDVTPWLFSAP